MGTKKEIEEQLATTKLELEQMKTALGHLKISNPGICYKEKKFPKFSGKVTIDVMEWTSDILAYMNERFQNDAVKVDFIMDHLEGKAKREIKFRLLGISTTAEDLVVMLVETFGKSDQVIRLHQTFYSRVQEDDESIEDYAYALTDMIIKMNTVKVKLAYPADQILKERFADGVRNTDLARELIRLNIELPMLKFVDLRKRALLWEERERKEVKSKT
jgi:hypothetical protein